jgi:hypothetical protein
VRALLAAQVAQLIMTGKVHARIDSHNKVLHARHADKRNQTFEQALTMGGAYARDVKAMVLRLNLMRNDFIVKGSVDSLHGPSKQSCRAERAEHHRNLGFAERSGNALAEGSM